MWSAVRRSTDHFSAAHNISELFIWTEGLVGTSMLMNEWQKRDESHPAFETPLGFSRLN